MGQTQAATFLAVMLERFATIKSPSAYLLPVLGKKAELGIAFCAGMIRAFDHETSTTSAGRFEGNKEMLKC
jgi:hypothetical protein